MNNHKDHYNKILNDSVNITTNKQLDKVYQIYEYTKWISNIDNDDGFTNIISFLCDIWEASGTILINNDIAMLLYDLYVIDGVLLLESRYPEISKLFIKSHSKYCPTIPQDDPLIHPQIVEIWINAIKCNHKDEIKNILRITLDNKNLYGASLILNKTDMSLLDVTDTLMDYNAYDSDLGSNLGSYVADNYLVVDHGSRIGNILSNYFMIDNINSVMISIIKKYYRFHFKYTNYYESIFFTTYIYLNKSYILHKCVIIDVLFDVVSEYVLVDKFLNDSISTTNMNEQWSQYQNLVKTKQQFKDLWNVDIIYTSQIDTKLVYLLLMIAKDSKYKNNGFKYIMRKIIGYYYKFLY